MSVFFIYRKFVFVQESSQEGASKSACGDTHSIYSRYIRVFLEIQAHRVFYVTEKNKFSFQN